MSYPNPPGDQPPYPSSPPASAPASAPAPGKPRLRGRTPRRLGWLFLLLAIVLFVVGGITGDKSESKVNDFQRVTILTSPPASEAELPTITFTKTGGYIAYYEAANVTRGISRIPEPTIRMQSPTGKVLDLKTPYGNRSDNKIKRLTYDHSGHKGVAVYQFHISETGKYKVLAGYADAPSGAKMAFGKSIATGQNTGGIIVIVGVLFLIAAIVLLIVGFVKRSRHKKELASPGYGAPAFGGPPAGGQWPQQQPGQQPQGGYPQQGYQPPPQQPQQGYQPPPQQQGGWQPPPSDQGQQPPPQQG
jgi:hypothetical protein